MKVLRYLLLLLVVSVVASCATMFAGGKDAIRLESEPAGAVVTTHNGLQLGVTPFTTSLDPDDYILQFALEGYQPQTYSLGKKVDGVAFLNLLCVLCWGIDFATGALWGLDEDYVKVSLAPADNETAMNMRLTNLACQNYAALESSARMGLIESATALSGSAVVSQATGISKDSCESTQR